MKLVRRVSLALLTLGLLTAVAFGIGIWQQGYRVYVVHTGSMMPTYNPGDVVIDRPGHDHLRVGQVITFRHSASTTDVVTHRITAITPTGLIHTKGDANKTADAWVIHPDMVDGTVARGVPRLGYAVVFLQQRSGIGALACAAIACALLWTLFFPTRSLTAAPAAGHGRTTLTATTT